MRRKRILIILMLLLAFALSSCAIRIATSLPTTSESTAPTTTVPTTAPATSALPAEWSIIADGASEFVLIVPRRAESAYISDIARSIRALAPSMKQTNDQSAPVEREILIGCTSRVESALVMARLAETASEEYFQFVIAETGGKLVVYAENDEAYSFVIDYLMVTYVQGGALTVPSSLWDVQSMTWVAYRDMLDKIAAEEAARLEAERLARVALLIEANSAFNTGDFGQIKTLSSRNPKPPVYPTVGAHPRLLVTAETMNEVRAGLTYSENIPAYLQYMKLSDVETDGVLGDPGDTHNVNYYVLAVIEAKAFRYLMTGDEEYGYAAIIAIKNYILTLKIVKLSDECRAYGYAMYIAACVYDWCHSLMTDVDRDQIVAGVQSRLATHLEIGFPPSKQGSVTGHGTEAQILRDWLAFAIATYDEYPDMYGYVASRLFEEYTQAPDFYLDSGSHWQGSAYGPYRYYFLLYAQLLISKMTNDTYDFMDARLAEPAITFLHYVRPDGQSLRIGDDFNERGKSYGKSAFAICAFYAASLYGNEVLKGYAYAELNAFATMPYNGNMALSPVILLCTNDTALERGDPYSTSLVRYNASPLGSIIARSAWNDKNAVLVYMKIGEAYSANHEHKDAGNFQIFYRGILASDSGFYETYNDAHNPAYNKQTIAHNCMLIYNPSKRNVGDWVYSGGQSIHRDRVNNENSTLSIWLSKSQSKQAKMLGADYALGKDGEGNETYLWSYIAGDLTNAYDSDTVDEASRYMLSVMTDDLENPMVFFVYDRVTAVKASYKKTFLLHVQQEPTVDSDAMTATVLNTKGDNGGKMLVQSLGTSVTYTVLGGEGNEFLVNGVNYPVYQDDGQTPYSFSGTVAEAGWGRIEISPMAQSKTDRLLTVMYVTDAENDTAQVLAREITGELVIGASIFDKVAVFPKNAGGHTAAFRFTESGEGEREYFVASLAAGEWSVSVNGAEPFTVTATEGGMTAFRAPAGTISMTPIK